MLDLSTIEQEIDRDPRVLSAYVLGSAVSGRMRPESDLDIAVLPVAGGPLSQGDISELSATLSLAAGRVVDVGILSSRNLIYASEALLKGRRFFCRDTFQTDLAVATLLGLTARFKFERREVVDAYTS
ncbi:MAG: nucleotidyltransferase domain-containing protein [Candidatus Hydrogenedentota bacterium]|nr:MAG: nucleotidyltransferase domain-containing protein [Candidatus Hydrogenedentota bacterium]